MLLRKHPRGCRKGLRSPEAQHSSPASLLLSVLAAQQTTLATSMTTTTRLPSPAPQLVRLRYLVIFCLKSHSMSISLSLNLFLMGDVLHFHA